MELTDSKVVIPPNKPAVVEAKEENTDSSKTNWVRSKVDDLRYYSKPSWEDKDVAGHLPKGYGFPQAVRKVRVGDAWQYEVKNSEGETYYLTASEKFVSVEHKPATSTAQKPTKSRKSGPIAIGEIKIVNVSAAAIIQDRPDRHRSKNLGTIRKGRAIQVTGSVRGKNSDSGYWEVIYDGDLAYVTGKFGEYTAY
ncbi:hypothetical protein [Rossellomorea aquimaris]|uniref:hypothetical protein n=1 Tax=Rossellomorea aquimaris TaxID=189382 RepID=UPI0009F96F68|nr:hypothetical protein [Rossellomorea aquimaris]